MERTRLGLEAGPMDEAARSVYGSLHLRSAVLAARAGRRPESDGHLAEARNLARTVPAAANHYGMEFGPANVALYEIAVAVDLGDAGRALRAAATIDTAGLSPATSGDACSSKPSRRSVCWSTRRCSSAKTPA